MAEHVEIHEKHFPHSEMYFAAARAETLLHQGERGRIAAGYVVAASAILAVAYKAGGAPDKTLIGIIPILALASTFLYLQENRLIRRIAYYIRDDEWLTVPFERSAARVWSPEILMWLRQPYFRSYWLTCNKVWKQLLFTQGTLGCWLIFGGSAFAASVVATTGKHASSIPDWATFGASALVMVFLISDYRWQWMALPPEHRLCPRDLEKHNARAGKDAQVG
jgi:hypothetical protein